MRTIRPTYHLLILLLVYGLQKGQGNVKDIVPLAPEMSGLVKKVDIPVNFSSGAINYSLNLYTLKLKNLGIPLTLSYQSTGFMPSQNASNIGLGWDLEIGGKISQNIKGLNDLSSPNETPYFPNGFPVDRPLKMGYSEYITDMTGAYNHPEYNFLRENSNSTLEANGTFIPHWGINADSEPDIFYFSFPGKSGKFFLDKSMKGRQMPAGKEIIDLTSHGFRITDTTGTIYEYTVFDNFELTTGGQIVTGSYPIGGSTIQYAGNYFLSKIVSSSDIVEFIYDNVQYGYSNPPSYSKGTSDGYNLPPGYSKEFEVKYSSEVIHQLPILKLIRVNGTARVLFNYNDTPRNDIKNHFSKKISSISNIVIKDENQIVSINFQHSYFGNSMNPSSNNSWLKLDALTINDQHYNFDYYNGALPEKDTEIKDAWGYYTVPQNRHKRYNEDNFKEYFYNGNKAPNDKAAELTVLKKITYPTKGEDNFIFESNTYNETNYKEYDCTENVLGLYPDGAFDESLPPIIFDTPTTVTLIYNLPTYSAPTTTTYLEIELRNISENYNVNLTSLSGHGQTQIILQPGTYVLKMRTAGLPDPFIKIAWSACGISYLGQRNLKVGGVRLSQITSKDHDGSTKIIRKISYEQNGISTGKLYDYPVFYELETIPWLKDFYDDFCAPIGYTVAYKKYHSTSLGEISGYNGNPVFYNKVEESFSDLENDNLGKTAYTFLNYDDQPLYYNNYFLTFNDNSWKRGQLQKTEFFRKNQSIPSKTITNLYKVLETPQDYTTESGLGFTAPSYPNEYHRMSYKFYVGSPEYFIMKYCAMLVNLAGFDYVGKKLVSAELYKESETVQEYLDGKILETVTNFTYGNRDHIQLTKQSRTFPDESILETSYQYAHEKGNTDMIAANMVGIPLETEVKKYKFTTDPDPKITSKTGIKYEKKTWDGKELILPDAALSYDLQNPSVSTTEILYKKYDSRGNLLQYNLKPNTNGNSGNPVTIIWGYNHTHPIAKIEGIGYDALMAISGISSIITDLETKSVADVSGATEQILITALDSFRKNSLVAAYQITTYTYNPLVGVTSITPPSGIREVYIYDTSNRLQVVKDVNGNTLKEYQYHYKP